MGIKNAALCSCNPLFNQDRATKQCRDRAFDCQMLWDMPGILGILFSTQDGCIHAASRSFYEAKGDSVEKTYTQNAFELLFGPEENQQRHLKRLLAVPGTFQMPIRLPCKIGSKTDFTGFFKVHGVDDQASALCLMIPKTVPGSIHSHNTSTQHLEKKIQTLQRRIDFMEAEKEELGLRAANHFETSIRPYIDKLKRKSKEKTTRLYLNIIEKSLVEMVYENSEGGALDEFESRLTPNENAVLQFIKQGKSSKEIADLMHVTLSAISFHRHNIRKKLGLRNRGTSLYTVVKKLYLHRCS